MAQVSHLTSVIHRIVIEQKGFILRALLYVLSLGLWYQLIRGPTCSFFAVDGVDEAIAWVPSVACRIQEMAMCPVALFFNFDFKIF